MDISNNLIKKSTSTLETMENYVCDDSPSSSYSSLYSKSKNAKNAKNAKKGNDGKEISLFDLASEHNYYDEFDVDIGNFMYMFVHHIQEFTKEYYGFIKDEINQDQSSSHSPSSSTELSNSQSSQSSIHTLYELSNNWRNRAYITFVYLKGLKTMQHVFTLLLYYTRNFSLVDYIMSQVIQDFICYVRENNNDENQIKLSIKDAILYTYRKSIFYIKKEFLKEPNEIVKEDYHEFITQIKTYVYNIQLSIHNLSPKQQMEEQDVDIIVKTILDITLDIGI